MARPTKLNPERIQRICDALRSGNTRQASAQYAGVNYHSLRRWERSNDDFADAIKKAEADHVVYCVATIKKAMPTHWQAAAWWLERRRPDDYGRNLTRRADRAMDKLLDEMLANIAGEGSGTGDDQNRDSTMP